ncbi:MAG: hypothetical protein GTO01_02605, partial [Xanthomonadales bacterium]|nr:hypothetical protein [Xanthomonadales bacterium]NIT07428.1 hypothetical protein [Xanthomonadales bacterium]
MSRWFVEKNGSGVEKAGTGIEKAGTGVEKTGTGIEKAGSGIEKAGSGLRKGLLTALLMTVCVASQLQANNLNPAGHLTISVDSDRVLVSWMIDGSVFSGVNSLQSSYARLSLTEVTVIPAESSLHGAGSGTGAKNKSGNGQSSLQVAGSGTGTDVAGSGTGTDVAGSGTGTDV